VSLNKQGINTSIHSGVTFPYHSNGRYILIEYFTCSRSLCYL